MNLYRNSIYFSLKSLEILARNPEKCWKKENLPLNRQGRYSSQTFTSQGLQPTMNG